MLTHIPATVIATIMIRMATAMIHMAIAMILLKQEDHLL